MHAASQPAPFFLFLSFSSHLRSPFRVAEVEGSEREGGAGEPGDWREQNNNGRRTWTVRSVLLVGMRANGAAPGREERKEQAPY